ncbi:helicase-exonuclease AddAB subunit AddA [Mediterraneibacter agrestimuris]|uniref:helicase-exonuclease AddAB subunit AddA n=1 Tax=Mediterraneibacter agrestimuris TaxID=2941333 RepID=UPI00203CF659|nr:helicase-exonuclease AddAB subunit AddA [Mediterraneibacter agrestimuris]
MGVQWTTEQQKVIELRNRNILVSAAAGSGKTAVLVERIIRMLTDETAPVDVDRLLIVTFTEAAAAEMKERIRGAIEVALEQNPGNVHLQRQATLIHSAQITTIHSFCLSVIREHFHVIDIDPGFRIAEEGELKLLKRDVLENLLEECYAGGTEEFLELVEKLGDGRTDKKLEELILQLYEYSRSYPQPEKWLRECVEQYVQCKAFMGKAEERIHQYLQDMQRVLDTGRKVCEEPDGPYMYAEMLESDQAQIEKVIQAEHFESMYEHMAALKWKALSRKKDESVSAEKREAVKTLRDSVKKMTKDLISAYFYEEPQELFQDMADAGRTMDVLAKLVNQFAKAFAEEKQRKNLIDFGDMEQFALRILTVEQDGALVPSVTAREYQEQFYEVMIDEYQDSNLIQEAILTSVSTVSQGKNNIFMVGDVKQSIYRFRLSRPELFMEKYDLYSTEDGEKQRIDLHKNFRSRSEVLDGVNYIFRQIMCKDLGGIQYDDKVALNPGAEFEPDMDEEGASRQKMELILVNPDWQKEAGDGGDVGEQGAVLEKGAAEERGRGEEIEETARRLEARIIARRIREMVRTANVTDKKTGKLRRAEYRDIVILTRSIKGWADVFSAVLAEEGVPAYAGSKEGYFETYEVSILLDYLQLLDNQRQDLPLAAVLTSPFVGLSAQELAEIRLAAKDGSFYEAAERLAQCSQTAESGTHAQSICKKLRRFYKQLTQFREIVPYTAIHELLRKLTEETGYGLYIAAMPGGEQRLANLDMLVEKASAFEGTSYKGLFNFVRYIEQLQKYDVDYGEANLADEQANTVRIMSIHKSKGLEFPIVFAAGMGKQFNTRDVTGSMIIHPELGVGLDAVDLERRTKIPTILKKVIQQEVKLENLGEELRVLYVALTRAKEKLIMIGQAGEKQLMQVIGSGDGTQPRASQEPEGESFPFHQLAGAKSYLDWVLPALLWEDAPVAIGVMGRQEIELAEKEEDLGDVLARDVLEHWNRGAVYDGELRKHLEQQSAYLYPYADEQKLKLKFTVSELKKRVYLKEESGELLYEEPEVVPLIPQFLREEEELTGASRGSAYHKLLELLDFRKEYEERSLADAVTKLKEEKKLSDEMADCIRITDILEFLHCGAGVRMQKAAVQSKLFKEQPFVLGVHAEEIYPDITSDETILVQGIIDVYFEEEGELVVLDYKTDNVRTAEQLKEKYHAQLDYYAQALEQLLQKRVKEKIIYSFTLGEEISV